jgi:hypothetical protein
MDLTLNENARKGRTMGKALAIFTVAFGGTMMGALSMVASAYGL